MLRRFLPEMKKRSLQTQTPSNIFDLMDNFWRNPFELSGFGEVQFPSVNVSENDNEVKVKAEMPGLEAKDIDISLQGNNLILQGEKKFEDEENKGNYHRIECSYGNFYRSVPLPAEVDEDKIKAKFKKGVLEVKLPKSEKAKSKKIEIES